MSPADRRVEPPKSVTLWICERGHLETHDERRLVAGGALVHLCRARGCRAATHEFVYTRPSAEPGRVRDWTRDESGRSNASPEFLRIVGEVARLVANETRTVASEPHITIEVEVVEHGVPGPHRAGMAVVRINGQEHAKLRTGEGTYRIDIHAPDFSVSRREFPDA